MDVTVIENDDFTYSITPVFNWNWERVSWRDSEEAKEGIFAEEFRTHKKAIREAELEGHIVNIF